MRFEKRKDYGEISRQSIKREMRAETEKYRRTETRQTQANEVRRIVSLTDTSYYAKYRRYIVNKLVRILRLTEFGSWEVEFVNDKDRIALNNAAGWSDRKCEYIFDGAKYE